MKSKPLIVILSALALSGCEKKSAVIPSKFLIAAKTVKDATHPEYIREGAVTFEGILSEKKVSHAQSYQMPTGRWCNFVMQFKFPDKLNMSLNLREIPGAVGKNPSLRAAGSIPSPKNHAPHHQSSQWRYVTCAAGPAGI